MKLSKFLPLAILVLLLILLTPLVKIHAEKFPPPILTAEFDQMSFAPLYPTYSWEPLPRTEFYQVQVVKIETVRDKIVRELLNDEAFNRTTDWTPLTESGDYYWQVRVVDKNQRPLSDWSDKKFFTVTTPTPFAVLGDSISHGGAAYIPAGQLSCQWETFSSVAVKNLARSGDTTQQMLDRFDSDVLPFRPKFLLIFGGINDIRTGADAESVIKNLAALREKCIANKITPIFCTVTPMNPDIMNQRGIFLTDGDWRHEREKINLWIMQTPYFVDVSSALTDEQGFLRADLTPDGLHPALRGKMLIGATIGDYLRANFTDKL